jgi:ABC-type nickel/cobalt efflux system permease component RcnA
MSSHETLERAEHAEHASHSNRRIALVIAILAAFLAFSETLGKSAQTAAISDNVEASNLWAFFQAKTIRRTLVETAAQEMAVAAAGSADDATKAARAKQIEAWQKTAQRYRSEPETHEGSVELMERAREAEHKRDTAMAKYHHYEIASALFQIGIVLASAAVITSTIALAYGAGLLGLAGLVFMGIGFFAPHAVHLFGH